MTHPDFCAETRRLLASIVKKTRLTDDLLKRPPFRFLHDLVLEISKNTGFGASLFSDFEKCADSVSSTRDRKIEFLNKLIAAVYFTLNPDKTDFSVSVSANKILAGLEPEHTNTLLQLLAMAATESFHNSKVAVARVLSGERVSRAVATPRESVSPMEIPQIVFCSDAKYNAGMKFEPRPVAGMEILLNDYHPFPKSSDVSTLVARLLLWKSKTSILAQPSASVAVANFSWKILFNFFISNVDRTKF
jgi:Microtubule-binding protein MIP-T3 CH-like domain